MIFSRLKWINTGIKDFFLPNCCLLCQRLLPEPETYVCSACWASLTVFPDRSGSPLRSLRGVLDRLWIGWSYERRLRSIVHLFKYEGRPELAEPLAREWIKTLPHPEELRHYDVLLPVPIHPARRRWRGYNQSELLAEYLGQAWGKPVKSQGVIRRVNTPSQTLLDREERWRSVAEAFSLQEAAAIHDLRVIIVDDLATSGGTLHALATLLHAAGAASVSAAVLTSPELGDS